VPLGLGARAASEVIKFLPEGGSISGLLRTLNASLDLPSGVGTFPLHRQGSTVATLISVAQALATAGKGGVIAVDDFGEDLDAASGQYMAATLRSSSAQCWIATRRSQVAEAFEPEELIRLARGGGGTRTVHYGKAPKTKPERLAARHLNLQILPAIASRAVVILEGPHDSAALRALSAKASAELGEPLPAATGVSIIDAAAADAAGGSSALGRLAAASRQLGLRTIAVLDHDGDGAHEERVLEATLASADVVVRLPPGHAIEMALLSGLDDGDIRAALRELNSGFGAELPVELDKLAGKQLADCSRRVLKSLGGLHAQFVGTLGSGRIPTVGLALLRACVRAAGDRSKLGILQL
jgi:hypothetical protein